jgi:ABC-type oligopeptide transport system substrate-binding subunit
VIPGEGIMDPDGQPVDTIELAHPTSGYDPLRHTAGLHVGEFIEQLGFDIDAQATEFSQLVGYTSDPDDLQYDMLILGWSLGNPAMPTYFDTFWRSDSATNNTGYESEEYDEAVGRFMTADDLGEAYEILWDELMPILNEDLPYVPLFDTPNVEGFRSAELQFPYTDVLGGIEFVDGQPSLVTEAQ